MRIILRRRRRCFCFVVVTFGVGGEVCIEHLFRMLQDYLFNDLRIVNRELESTVSGVLGPIAEGNEVFCKFAEQRVQLPHGPVGSCSLLNDCCVCYSPFPGRIAGFADKRAKVGDEFLGHKMSLLCCVIIHFNYTTK